MIEYGSMSTATKKSKVKYATGIFIRPTFTGKKKLKLCAKVNDLKQGEVVRKLLDEGIGENGELRLK